MPLVRLPGKPAPTGPKSGVKVDRQKILYVEDEDEHFIVAEFALRDRFHLIRAQNALQACKILQTEDVPVIIMDIELSRSDLNGIELTQIIRKVRTHDIPDYARELSLKNSRIIVVTAFAGRYSEADVLEAGGDVLVTKPIDFKKLGQTIQSFLENTADTQAAPSPRRISRPERRKEVRVKVKLDCVIGMWDEAYPAQIWDVSAAGARVRFNKVVPVELVYEGAQCRITFSAPSGFIESKAEIMWSKNVGQVEIGILFQDMQAEAQQILMKELSRAKENNVQPNV